MDLGDFYKAILGALASLIIGILGFMSTKIVSSNKRKKDNCFTCHKKIEDIIFKIESINKENSGKYQQRMDYYNTHFNTIENDIKSLRQFVEFSCDKQSDKLQIVLNKCLNCKQF